ncbi:serine protease snake-like [Anoplophora glabripennis]|uniref:serine protease snake-like n=1 Tax=Anoplophora glabripennis TaxID=217634 RepID=UPI000873D7C2|nr:serine protease snake-like [Anoplophora glabripennis]
MAKITRIIVIVSIVATSGFAQRKAKDMCGDFVSQIFEEEITGGKRTKDDEFPHMAALGFGSLNRPVWLCGGTLISDQFVLTAAHCTHLRQVGPVRIVRLGTKTLNPRRGQRYTDVRVTETINHPDYNPPSSYNDIALLKLQRKVQFSRNILPACLNNAFNVNLATKTLLALGWGKMDFAGPTSNDLLKAELRVVSNRECKRSYRGSSRNKLPEGVKEERQLCAGDDVQDTCQGDSGGPLEYKNGRFHYIVGITSFGKACGISNDPGVYTRVSAFIPWIESEVWP